ncbi:MAG: four helix bundle protein [Spirochaetaceae bacterium]|nr:four helix bundle protein [Spirochaetaceae bacterium]
MKESILQEKSKRFAIRIVNLFKHLTNEKKEFIMSKQLLKSGTSVGANIMEAEHAQSNLDFIHKNNIALKEANEAKYWLELLFETEYLTKEQYESIKTDCDELLKMLVSTIKTLKSKT